MIKKCIHLILVSMFSMLFPVIANAELYKWLDENGVVHYGDAKPKTGTASTPQIKLNQAGASNNISGVIPQIATKKPIKNDSGKPVKSVQLEKIIIDMTDSTTERKVIGADYFGENCLKKSQDIVITGNRNQLNNINAEKKINEIFLAQNYKYIAKRDVIFQGQQAESAELSMAAIINDIKLNVCQLGNNKLKAKVETYIKVEWQLFDPLDRRILFKGQTEGYDKNEYDNIADSAGGNGLNKAFANAMLNLLSDYNFVQLLENVDEQPKASSDNSQPLKILTKSLNRNSRFVDSADVLQNSVVTVRTSTGHGSGFYITQDGYILTNAHVVSDAQTVLIVTKNRQFKADVIRKNQQRDIALLKPRDAINVLPLSLSGKPIRLGDSIFVIGTPLDEKLEHTITSGIVSASRKKDDGLNFYQTDATINPGNSGGPAFNNTGEVIGIAVSSLVNKTGSGLSINFLIPIDDALNKLNLVFK